MWVNQVIPIIPSTSHQPYPKTCRHSALKIEIQAKGSSANCNTAPTASAIINITINSLFLLMSSNNLFISNPR